MSAREEYLTALDVELARRMPDADRVRLVAETGEAISEAFEGLGRAETIDEIEEEFGPAATLAEALAEERAARTEQPRDDARRVLGVPVEARMPTAERLASRMWNPADPRIFVPRVFGIGWDVNFGAVAVKLHLMRPDDVEEVPFARVPRVLTVGLTLASLALLLGALVVSAIWAPTLPDRIPYHFGLRGPDAFAAPLSSALQLLGIPLAIVVLIAVRTFLRPASALARGLTAAASPAIALIGLGMWGNAVSWAVRGSYVLPLPVVVVLPLLVLFALLLGLTRLGLRREWREHGVR